MQASSLTVRRVYLFVCCQTAFDSLFRRLYSPKHEISRVDALQAQGATTVFPVALFSHPGYTNMLFAYLNKDGTCVLVPSPQTVSDTPVVPCLCRKQLCASQS